MMIIIVIIITIVILKNQEAGLVLFDTEENYGLHFVYKKAPPQKSKDKKISGNNSENKKPRLSPLGMTSLGVSLAQTLFLARMEAR